MSFENTWTFSLNNTPTDQTTVLRTCASYLQQLKNFLVSNGWSIVQTCDSTQVATGSDVLTDVTTDWVWSAAGVHTWYSLKSPVGIVVGLDGSGTGDQSRIWFTADCNSANAYQVTFRFHNAAPTGGTTSAAPTSTNQIGWATQQIVRNSIAGCKFNFAITATGAWYSTLSYTLSGYTATFLALWPLTDLVTFSSTGYSYPHGVWPISVFYDGSTGAIYLPITGGLVSNSFRAADVQSKCWSPTGTAGISIPMIVTGYYTAGSDLAYMMGLGEAVAGTGDSLNNKFYRTPVWVGNYASSSKNLIGRATDFYEGGGVLPKGSVSPSLVSPEWHKLGYFWVPTNALWVL